MYQIAADYDRKARQAGAVEPKEIRNRYATRVDPTAGARFTSAADIVATQTDVCFVPIADIPPFIPSSCARATNGPPVTNL